CPPPRAGRVGSRRGPAYRSRERGPREQTWHTRDLISGAAAGVVGGYVGTKVMNPVTTKLYELAPEADKAREKAVSPGSPYRIGVQKAAGLLGISLTEEQLNAAAAAAPYMVGISGGLLYVALRRVLHLNPIV